MAKCETKYYDTKTGYEFPCGKCLECRKSRISGWSFRLQKEIQRSDSAFFLTLTYDTDHVHLTDNGYMTLDKGYKTKHGKSYDLQRFLKRLRKKDGTNKIKFYAVGEYGTAGNRPHYHLLIFNAKLEMLTDGMHRLALAFPKVYLNGKYQYNIELWEYGHITIGTVTPASIGYCLKYMSKPSKVPKHQKDDRKKEFSVQSNGLGSNYLSDRSRAWHNSELEKRMYLPYQEKKLQIPRYYKIRLYDSLERQYVAEYLREQYEYELQNQTNEQKLQEYDKKINRINANNTKLRRTEPVRETPF